MGATWACSSTITWTQLFLLIATFGETESQGAVQQGPLVMCPLFQGWGGREANSGHSTAGAGCFWRKPALFPPAKARGSRPRTPVLLGVRGKPKNMPSGAAVMAQTAFLLADLGPPAQLFCASVSPSAT